jgi:acetylornithine deacetylase
MDANGCIVLTSQHNHTHTHTHYHTLSHTITHTQQSGEKFDGKITFTVDRDIYKGIACHIDSPGFKALRDATDKVKGSVSPYSVGGSLPLVGDMQAAGFDLQICGYGLSSVYHGLNEYCNLSDMQAAMRIFSAVIDTINAQQ